MIIKVADLFCGIGGFRNGLEQASNNYKFVYSNDYDKYASSIYKKHYGECDTRDITKVPSTDIPDHDLLVGGFPCQPFSISGKRKGFEDTRGTMFFEIARILRDKRPRYFLLENVKGLLSSEEGKNFQTILGILTDLGFEFQWQVLNSKFFGVPQNRERVFIVGYSGKGSRPKIFPIGESNSGLIQDSKDKKGQTYSWALRGRDYKDGTNFIMTKPKEIKRIAHNKNFRRYNQTYDASGLVEALDTSSGGGHQPCVLAWSKSVETHKGRTRNEQRVKIGEFNTLSTGDGCRNKSSQNFIGKETQIRRLTPVECERLQNFPDGWTKYGVNGELISDSQRYKVLGNAVTCSVIKAIGEKLIKEIQ